MRLRSRPQLQSAENSEEHEREATHIQEFGRHNGSAALSIGDLWRRVHLGTVQGVVGILGVSSPTCVILIHPAPAPLRPSEVTVTHTCRGRHPKGHQRIFISGRHLNTFRWGLAYRTFTGAPSQHSQHPYAVETHLCQPCRPVTWVEGRLEARRQKKTCPSVGTRRSV